MRGLLTRRAQDLKRLADPAWSIDGHYAAGTIDETGQIDWAIHCPWTNGYGTGAQPCTCLVANLTEQPAEPEMGCCGMRDLMCEHWVAYESWQPWALDVSGACWLVTYLADSGEPLWTDAGCWTVPVRSKNYLAWRGIGDQMDSYPVIVPADVVRAARDERMASVLVDSGRLSVRQ